MRVIIRPEVTRESSGIEQAFLDEYRGREIEVNRVGDSYSYRVMMEDVPQWSLLRDELEFPDGGQDNEILEDEDVECEWCGDSLYVDKDDYCEAKNPSRSLVCTRQKGHSGPHIACAEREHDLCGPWYHDYREIGEKEE